MRVAWFSPMPPVRSGIAACSADVVPALRARHEIDIFVDEPNAAVARGFRLNAEATENAEATKKAEATERAEATELERAPGTLSAHEFLRLHRQAPYDLTVYQVGNSSHHDYLWPYLFRYPGLTVLHDAHLHHARAAALLRTSRAADYRAEFAANHPNDRADAAELAIAGFDSHLYYMWPMTRLILKRSKLSAVHSRQLAVQLRDDLGASRVEYLRLSQGVAVSAERERAARETVRARYSIARDAVTFGSFGGLSPEKRVPQILNAFADVLKYAPDARLVLAGAPAEHYDVSGDVRSRGLADRVVVTGYLPSDDELTDCIAAVDVTLNLRWPTARELSGPWLRSLAAAKPSIVVDTAHTADVPSLDPRTWTPHAGGHRGTRSPDPIAVAIDIMDEDHSLRLAMRRLAADATLRRALGEAARRYWDREHAPAAMVDDYERLMAAARERPAPSPELPAHLLDDGRRRLDALMAPFGLPAPLA